MKKNSYIKNLIFFSELQNKQNPEWRKGQAIVNCATISCYHLCNPLLKTDKDCFYDDNHIPNFLNGLSVKMKTDTPYVGIFWIYNGFVIFSHAVSVVEGLAYGTAITGIKDHADYWEETKNWHGFIPEEFRNEYFSIPRGRVVYHSDTDKFYVYHGNNLKKTELNQIVELFCLPRNKTLFEKDIHYCDLSEAEWKNL